MGVSTLQSIRVSSELVGFLSRFICHTGGFVIHCLDEQADKDLALPLNGKPMSPVNPLKLDTAHL